MHGSDYAAPVLATLATGLALHWLGALPPWPIVLWILAGGVLFAAHEGAR